MQNCAPIDSLAIHNSPETTGVTSFVQEACTAVAAVDTSFSSTLFPVQPELQDVAAYFSRPVCVKSDNLPTGVRQRIFNTQPSFGSWLAYWSIGRERLLGAYGIRASLVFTLQVAATPFHQGLVSLSFQYGADAAYATSGCYFRALRSCTATNLPHVVCDLSSDSMVQLKVPFHFVTEYARIAASPQNPAYGSVAINTLTAVPTVAGMTSPSYQLYVHLEDIQLFGASPQAFNTITLSSGRSLNPVAQEFEEASKPVSGPLKVMSKALSFVARGVPSLSSLLGSPVWALNKAAGVISAFGYGKPAVCDPVVRIFRQDNICEFNTDIPSAINVLAISGKNTTAITTAVGATDVDEMSLSYVTSRWGQICYFNYDTSVTAGTRIYATPINPLCMWFRDFASGGFACNKQPISTSGASANSFQPSHIMFASTCFKQWRGGMKFRFTFAKTKMHAGRVMVAFNPDMYSKSLFEFFNTATVVNSAGYGSLGPDPFGYSAVFDLKDGNVFEFMVPYVAPSPYVTVCTNTGSLSMYVVNPLIAPSVVSSSIQVLVEVAGAPDFELACPSGIMFPAHNAGTIAVQCGRSLSSTRSRKWDVSLQSGRLLSQAPAGIDETTMGEAITSVKQLISMPHVRTSDFITAGLWGLIPPWFFQPTPGSATPSAGDAPGWSFSYGGNWASCYAFLKGGTDVHLYNSGPSVNMGVYQYAQFGPHVSTSDGPYNRSNSCVPLIQANEGAIHARLPLFAGTQRIPSYLANIIVSPGATWAYGTTYDVTPSDMYNTLQQLYIFSITPNTTATTSYFNISRNASDDAQLGMYIGPPPLWVPGTVGVGLFDPDLDPFNF